MVKSIRKDKETRKKANVLADKKLNNLRKRVDESKEKQVLKK